jgi:hypothetical protein
MTHTWIAFALVLAACVPPQGGASPDYPGYSAPAAEPGPTGDVQRTPAAEPGPAGDVQRAPAAHRSITINGAALNPARAQTLAQLEAASHATLPDGAYWYDRMNGAFGVWGQPGAAVIPAGLDLGPPLPRNASNGRSGVFINNRELQPVEVQFLSQLVGVPWQPGRYFIDAQGNAGLEGGVVLVNLVQVASQRAQASGARREVHSTTGYGDNQKWFYSDGKCRTFFTAKGDIISSGC